MDGYLVESRESGAYGGPAELAEDQPGGVLRVDHRRGRGGDRALLLWAAALLVGGALLAAAQLPTATANRGAARHPHGERAVLASRTKRKPKPRPRVIEAYATYYGWFTNTPPGCATAYAGCAHGAGTYTNPITFASDRKEFLVGTRLYYPTLQKYFIMGDECTECTADWKGKGPDGGPHLHHVDLWIGGKGADAFDAINCEDALTQSTPSGAPLLTPFVVHPPATLPVSSEPLFDARSGRCFGGTTTTATYGRYENAAAGSCLAIAGGTSKTRAAGLEPCGTSNSEDLAFEGAFFVTEHRCLQTETGRVGSRIVFAPCTGTARQQWETTRSGGIEWVQHVRCVVDRGGRLVLGSCRTGAAGTWRYVTEQAPSRAGAA